MLIGFDAFTYLPSKLIGWTWFEQKASDKVKQLNAVLHEKDLQMEALQGDLNSARQTEELQCEEYGELLTDLESTATAIEWLHAICVQQLLKVKLKA
jgi:hypothetical protein